MILTEVDCRPGVDLDYSDSPSPVSCGFMEGFGLDLGLDSGLPISTVRHSHTGLGPLASDTIVSVFIRIPDSVLATSSVYDNYQVIKDRRKETKYSIAPSVSGT